MRGQLADGSLIRLHWEPAPQETTIFMIRHADKWCSPVVRGFMEIAEEVIRGRFEKAVREIKRCVDYDYIVINEEIDRAVEEIISIILSDRARKSRRLPMVEKIFGMSLTPK